MSFNAFKVVKNKASKAKSIINDFKEVGAVKTMKNIFFMKEAYLDKGEKTLVGEDQYGNRYWEAKEGVSVHRYRWIEFPGKEDRIYDPSRIPSEWHGWLHYIRDEPPNVQEKDGTDAQVPRGSKVPHVRSQSGTVNQYYVPGHLLNPVQRKIKNPNNQVFLDWNDDAPLDMKISSVRKAIALTTNKEDKLVLKEFLDELYALEEEDEL